MIEPYFETALGKLYHGSVFDVLPKMESGSVNCAVTSPPYWGLRDYGTAEWAGGDPECDHKKTSLYGSASTLRNDGRAHKGPYDGEKGAVESVTQFKDICGKCGARRIDNQIGLEKTPEEYVEKIVAVFREVRRVLRDDGTIWVNLGDSYNSIGHKKSSSGYGTTGLAGGKAQEHTILRHKNTDPNLKHKDLCGIPWRVAFALQADGWFLRQDIIWHKPNPMPESVTDRCTKSHEYIFLLSKSAKYFYDADAIKEPVNGTAHRRGAMKTPDGWDTGKGPHGSFHKNGREKGHKSWNGSQFHTGKTAIHQLGRSQKVRGVTPKSAEPGSGIKANESFHAATVDLVENRNKRSVWTVPTKPYSEAHFATFPNALIRPCILAGCPKGGTVLDPFGGSGTTAEECEKLGRGWMLIELSGEYCWIAQKRIARESQQLKLF